MNVCLVDLRRRSAIVTPWKLPRSTHRHQEQHPQLKPLSNCAGDPLLHPGVQGVGLHLLPEHQDQPVPRHPGNSGEGRHARRNHSLLHRRQAHLPLHVSFTSWSGDASFFFSFPFVMRCRTNQIKSNQTQPNPTCTSVCNWFHVFLHLFLVLCSSGALMCKSLHRSPHLS